MPLANFEELDNLFDVSLATGEYAMSGEKEKEGEEEEGEEEGTGDEKDIEDNDDDTVEEKARKRKGGRTAASNKEKGSDEDSEESDPYNKAIQIRRDKQEAKEKKKRKVTPKQPTKSEVWEKSAMVLENLNKTMVSIVEKKNNNDNNNNNNNNNTKPVKLQVFNELWENFTGPISGAMKLAYKLYVISWKDADNFYDAFDLQDRIIDLTEFLGKEERNDLQITPNQSNKENTYDGFPL